MYMYIAVPPRPEFTQITTYENKGKRNNSWVFFKSEWIQTDFLNTEIINCQNITPKKEFFSLFTSDYVYDYLTELKLKKKRLIFVRDKSNRFIGQIETNITFDIKNISELSIKNDKLVVAWDQFQLTGIVGDLMMQMNK